MTTREYTSQGWIDGDVMCHYGVTVDIKGNPPTTGVLSNNDIEYLDDETMDGIDLDWETWLKDFEEENGREPTDDERDEAADCGQSSTYLIGDWTEEQGEYHPVDGAKGFSAIVGESTTQVVLSKTTTKAAMCSPCYPGQADVGSDGSVVCYTLPTDLIGSHPRDAYNTTLNTWFERDRAHVELRDKFDQTIVEWRDDAVQEAIDDGFLKASDLHTSAIEYANAHNL